jgi:hypothetical protein
VTEQARHRCGYCLTSEAIVGTPMEIDHIIPRSLGGATDETNLWLACSLCNGHKADRVAAIDYPTGEVVRLFDPRHQVWRDHFAWTLGGGHIVGLTPVGRATVVALTLNRPSLVKARQLWAVAGRHPPGE